MESSKDNEIEVSAIVSEFTQRLKRLEESLVDQKVKLEIIDLRLNRGVQRQQSSPPLSSQSLFDSRTNASTPEDIQLRPSLVEPQARPGPNFPNNKLTVEHGGDHNGSSSNNSGVDKRPGSTEMQVLKIVFEGRGKISAKEIQQRIGRTREHTARMMNGLYHEGLVERDVTARPFSYSITEKGRDLLNS